jgi:hypothetical protein
MADRVEGFRDRLPVLFELLYGLAIASGIEAYVGHVEELLKSPVAKEMSWWGFGRVAACGLVAVIVSLADWMAYYLRPPRYQSFARFGVDILAALVMYALFVTATDLEAFLWSLLLYAILFAAYPWLRRRDGDYAGPARDGAAHAPREFRGTCLSLVSVASIAYCVVPVFATRSYPRDVVGVGASLVTLICAGLAVTHVWDEWKPGREEAALRRPRRIVVSFKDAAAAPLLTTFAAVVAVPLAGNNGVRWGRRTAGEKFGDIAFDVADTGVYEVTVAIPRHGASTIIVDVKDDGAAADIRLPPPDASATKTS